MEIEIISVICHGCCLDVWRPGSFLLSGYTHTHTSVQQVILKQQLVGFPVCPRGSGQLVLLKETSHPLETNKSPADQQ